MSNAMTEIKATASAHMRRDLETGPKWTCECDACGHVRSLVGMEKVLEVELTSKERVDLGKSAEAVREPMSKLTI